MRYTREDDVTARRLAAEDASDSVFRATMGRSRESVLRHLRWLDDPMLRKAHAASGKRRREGKARSYIVVTPRIVPPDAAILDAQRRHQAPRSLTASVFGDPPRGYSALDLRNSEARA